MAYRGALWMTMLLTSLLPLNGRAQEAGKEYADSSWHAEYRLDPRAVPPWTLADELSADGCFSVGMEDKDGDGDFETYACRRNSDGSWVSLEAVKGRNGRINYPRLKKGAVRPGSSGGMLVDYDDTDGDGRLESSFHWLNMVSGEEVSIGIGAGRKGRPRYSNVDPDAVQPHEAFYYVTEHNICIEYVHPNKDPHSRLRSVIYVAKDGNRIPLNVTGKRMKMIFGPPFAEKKIGVEI